MNELGLYAGSVDLRRASLRDLEMTKDMQKESETIPNFQYHHGNDEIYI